ncbi:nitrogenase cofactor biosynthesis protein NifB [Fusibacter paucivorans]|uniref:FeMo cofactor biosynthesis protein NifB n=1 Tax=Fusibacter paucivorans TaxID=76009 RepID=A0ABS5PMY5_9FIRM|nr:nitrogenase cofactor biosynthesis protein NifB [Fusibacter paucivorans]MBS7526257.1 nitrogenase cofactor biosynthesis protein NifB [Fusibacter paucivorans]
MMHKSLFEMSKLDFDLPANTTADVAEKTLKHPCFNGNAKEYARMHLPIAPRCNIKCNYCNRKFDCANESRPGVASEIMSPQRALSRFLEVKQQYEKLSVIGIAGPGDALANYKNTRETLMLIREHDSEVAFCISTNGLMLYEYADALHELGVSHVTVTMNALDPEIGAIIYDHIRYKGEIHRGVAAAKILIEKQLLGIKKAADLGMLVKINTVAITGVNDHHIVEVVKKATELGAALSNIIPLIPVVGTAFEENTPIDDEALGVLRTEAGKYLSQMLHCRQCRADAVGRLGDSGDKGHAGGCRKLNVG